MELYNFTSMLIIDQVILASLLRTLEEFLAEDLTSEIRHVWITVYGMIAETMIDADEN